MKLRRYETGFAGTAEIPVFFSEMGWEQAHDVVRDLVKHVHHLNGSCAKNVFGEPCHTLPLALPDWGQECADPACHRPAVAESANGDWNCGVHQCL